MTAHGRTSQLSAEDLARPARELPSKVIRGLGHQLHNQLQNSGNWETVAEDLGYEFEDIKQFTTLANVRQEVTPGEIMLRDWVQRGNGRTLFVLHNALFKAGRLDCVEFLEKEIHDKVVYMNLMICVKDKYSDNTSHSCIRTRTDASLLDSLQNVLELPVSHFKVLDAGTSLSGTQAKEYKGRQLMLLRTSLGTPMDQDPTVGSSSAALSSSQDYPHFETSQKSLRTSNEALPQDLKTMRVNHMSIGASNSSPSGTGPVVISSSETQPGTSRQNNFMCLSNKMLPVTSTNNNNCNNNLNLEYVNREIPSCPLTSPMNIHPNEEKVQNMVTRNTFQFPGTERQVDTDKVGQRSDEDGNIQSYTQCCMNSVGSSCENNSSNTDFMNTDYQGSFESILEDSDDARYQEHSSDSVYADMFEYDYATDVIPESGDETFVKCPDRDESMTFVKHPDGDESMTFVKHPDGDESMTFVKHPDGDESMTFVKHPVGDESMTFVKHPVGDESMTFVKHPVGDESMTFVKHPVGDESMTFVKHSDRDESMTFVKCADRDESMTFVKCLDRDDSITHQCRTNVQTFKHNTQVGQLPSCDDIQKRNYYDDTGAQGICDTQPESQTNTHTDAYRTQTAARQNTQIVSTETSQGLQVTNDCEMREVDLDPVIYLDFNEFSQTSVGCNDLTCHTTETVGRVTFLNDESESQSREQYSRKPAKNGSAGGRGVIPRRCISEPGTAQQKGYLYESLHHRASITSDFYYETPHDFNQHEQEKLRRSQSAVHSERDNAFNASTIADVFSPVEEKSGFYFKREDDDDSCCPSSTSTSGSSAEFFSAKRNQTFPRNKSPTRYNDNRKKRSTLPCRERSTIVHFSEANIIERYSQDLSSSDDSLVNERSVSGKTLNQIPLRSKVAPHPYRLVVGGKTSRPSLDHMLADDRLFTHYNLVLKEFIGWSPRETEYTIEKTMADTVHKDGYYILWYCRSRKNLVLSVSNGGAMVHFRIHTKIREQTLHFYITQTSMFPDLIQLLRYHESNGLRSPVTCGPEGRSSLAHRKQRRQSAWVWMVCPVRVQYEKRKAISV